MFSKLWSEGDGKWMLFVLCLAFALYLPTLGMWAYGDDFVHLARAISVFTRWEIFHCSTYAYRPLERLVNSTNVALTGYNNLCFSHAIGLLGYLLSVVLVSRIAKLLYPGISNGIKFATLLFVVMPANVMSVTEIDTISQQYATVFSLFLFWWLLRENRYSGLIDYGMTGLLVVLALLNKETSLGVVVALPLVVWFMRGNLTRKVSGLALRKLLSSFVVVFASCGIYLAIRWASGASFHAPTTGRATSIMHLMVSMVKNICQLFGGVAYVGSHCELFPPSNVPRIAISVALTLLLAACGCIGLYRLLQTKHVQKDEVAEDCDQVRYKHVALGLGSLALVGAFPAVMCEHVSELYLYGLAPYYALLLGLLIGPVLQPEVIRHFSNAETRGTRVMAYVLVFATIGWLAYGTHEKVVMTRSVSDRAVSFFERVTTWLTSACEKGQRVSLVWRDTGAVKKTSYSAYVWTDDDLLIDILSFAGFLQSKTIDFVTRDRSEASQAEYVAFVDAGGLQIQRNMKSRARASDGGL